MRSVISDLAIFTKSTLLLSALLATACGSSGGASSSPTATANTPQPTLTLSSSSASIAADAKVTLSWQSSNVDDCKASVGWTGSKEASGNESVGPLSTDTRFVLTCQGGGTEVVRELTVTIADGGGSGSSGGTGGANPDMPTYQGNIIRVTPDMSLQAVLNQAQPGDVIMLAPGTFYESLVVARSGTIDKPIVIIAEEPGRTTISGATTPDFDLQFSSVGDDLYSASVPWTVRWVMVDGRNLMGYDDLQGLQDFTILGHDTNALEPGPPEGFAWENGTLYVRLLDGENPAATNIQVHRSFSEADSPALNTDYFGDRAWPTNGDLALDNSAGANITITGSHVVIAGLKLHLAPLAAINVAADDVTIHDNYISGAWRSIRAGGSNRVKVEHNEFSGYPAYQWVRWGSINGDRRGLWNAIYNSNLNINHVHHFGNSFELNNNLIYECFDCLWPRNMGNLDPNNTSKYSENLIMSCGDECIEFDTRQAINLRVHDNFIMDATAVLALSPVQGGGLTLDHNIVYSSPEYGLQSTVLLKFDCPWCASGSDPTQGVTMVHNTFVSSTGALYWTGESHTYQNNIGENNIFFTRMESGWVHPDFTLSEFNLHATPNVDTNARNMTHLIHANSPDFTSGPSMSPGALVGGSRQILPVIPLQSSTPVTDDPDVDFTLQANGVAVDAGNPNIGLDSVYHHQRSGDSADLGAIELGDSWSMKTGPRWATGSNIPWRPGLPPSLPPHWVGLEP